MSDSLLRVAPFALATLALVAVRAPAPAQTPAISLSVDARSAAQKVYHVSEMLPATPGAFTFVYPKWIPGYHGPVGPIEGVVSLRVTAGGATLDWRRDLVDMYAVHTTVPANATNLHVDFDVVGAPSRNGQNEPVSTSQLALVEFSNFTIYPQGANALSTPVDASLTLPAGWTFGTALPIRSHDGPVVSFATTSLYTLIDSPVIAGAHHRRFDLGPNEFLDTASDSDAGATPTAKFLTGMKHLVAEGPALYGGRHYRDYHFLLTLSDEIDPEGIEHHESSDDRAGEMYAADDDEYSYFADLLPHEYSHSWNGKYRRPGDLFVTNYQDPEKTDLLWVYEGLNQYNGEKLSTRSRLNSFDIQLDELAAAAASMDVESGRHWRPVRDTADGAPFLYVAPSPYYAIRRSAGDFYTEGNLIWLEADVTIRRLTHDRKSLDDFCRLYGRGSDMKSVPGVDPYDEPQILSLLNQVAPYDWAAFFNARIADIAPHAPLGGITGAGYKLVYDDKASELEKKASRGGKGGVDARYSIGLSLSADGHINDILTQSPAFAAGLAPGMQIVAIDGRKYSDDVLHAALKAHKGKTSLMELTYANGDFIRMSPIDAHEGERYPHLVRVAGSPDVLRRIYAPRTYAAPNDRAGNKS